MFSFVLSVVIVVKFTILNMLVFFLSVAGRELLSLMALSLNLDEDFFEKIGALFKPDAFLRLLHYPGLVTLIGSFHLRSVLQLTFFCVLQILYINLFSLLHSEQPL